MKPQAKQRPKLDAPAAVAGILARLIGAEQAEPMPAEPLCPGASLRLMRSDYDALVAEGERFATAREELPRDGYGDARLACEATCAEVSDPVARLRSWYARCTYCEAFERSNRAQLRTRAAASSAATGTDTSIRR